MELGAVDPGVGVEVGLADLTRLAEQVERVVPDDLDARMLQAPPLRLVQATGAEVIQQQTQFGQLLAAAETDSYEVWELRKQWQRYQGLVSELAQVLEQGRESFNELQSLELKTYFPNLELFNAEINRRLAQVECMLADQQPERWSLRLLLLHEITHLVQLRYPELPDDPGLVLPDLGLVGQGTLAAVPVSRDQYEHHQEAGQITPDRLHALGRAALANRRRRFGDKATYVFNLQINPANICGSGCYCISSISKCIHSRSTEILHSSHWFPI